MRPELLAVFAHGLAGPLDREDALGILPAELEAARRLTSRKHDRESFWRRCHIDRSPALEVLPHVVDLVNLRGVGIDAGFAVHHDRVALPTVPQLVDDLHELIGPLVPLIVARYRVEPHRGRFLRVRTRHHVPAGAALGEMRQREERSRRDIRVCVGGGERRGHPDLLGCRGDHGHERDRVVYRELQRVPHGRVDRALVGVVDAEDVRDEDDVEPPPLENPADVLPERHRCVVIAGHIPLEPPLADGVLRGSVEEHHAEVHVIAHANPSATGRPVTASYARERDGRTGRWMGLTPVPSPPFVERGDLSVVVRIADTDFKCRTGHAP